MLRTLTAASLAFTLSTTSLMAQGADSAKVYALFDALGMHEVLDIMREEGFDYGASIADEMLPGGATQAWADVVGTIYDPDMMLEEVRGAFGEALEGDDIDAMLAFYTSEPGAKIAKLEVSARRALLDSEIEEASIETSMLARLDETPRFLQVQEFVEVNDLVEGNVVGALNASYAFYLGLIDGGMMPAGITPEVALGEVWAQEDDFRDSTEEWIYSFLMLAYQPLSDEEMAAHIAFSKTEAGQDLTAALFVSFEGMFNDISRALGLAASRFMATQEL